MPQSVSTVAEPLCNVPGNVDLSSQRPRAQANAMANGNGGWPLSQPALARRLVLTDTRFPLGVLECRAMAKVFARRLSTQPNAR